MTSGAVANTSMKYPGQGVVSAMAERAALRYVLAERNLAETSLQKGRYAEA